MTEFFVFGSFLSLILLALSAAESVSFKDPLENTCEVENVIIESILDKHHDHHEVTLYRLCASDQIIDFSLPVQILTMCRGFQRRFINGSDVALKGDKFVVVKNNETTQVTLSPEMEEYIVQSIDVHECILVQVTHQGHQKPKPKIQYVNAEIVINVDSEENREVVSFAPVWNEKIPYGETFHTEMFPGPNSTQISRNVTIMSAWLNIYDWEGFHATTLISEKKTHREYITVFYDPPRMWHNFRLFPDFVNVTLLNPPGSQTDYHDEVIELRPGWIGELEETKNQTLVPGDDSQFKRQEVTVRPGYIRLYEGEGVHGKIPLGYSEQVVTIYYI